MSVTGWKMLSGPYSSRHFFTWEAKMSSASSQPMRSHSSRPRMSPLGSSGLHPLRFMGYLTRSADSMLLIMARPRGQARRCGLIGVSSPDSSVRM